ncbi:MAG TPA: hypothetical protein VNG95_06190, partial [Gemmatimonadales bacterium]|nr:hypothetical protein [Gemmatimonadales bacterium]
MAEGLIAALRKHRIDVWIVCVSAAALWLLLQPEWSFPVVASQVYWNAVAAFTITAVLCDAWFLKIPFANL